MSSPTLIIGDGKWAVKSGSLLGYEYGELSGQFAPIPITGSRASTANYIDQSGLIVSASSGVLRVDYSTGTGSLLLEPQRTNLALYSQQFDHAFWIKTNSSVTANNTTSPDGSSNADSLIDNSTNGIHALTAQSMGGAGTYAFSFYAKANTLSRVAVFTNSGVNLNLAITAQVFDLSSGTVVNTVTGITATITSVGNGWFRCQCIIPSSGSGNYLICCVSGGTTTSYIGSGQSLFLYGAQLEAGAFPTTYIPTTSTSVTRIADTFSRSNIYTDGVITSAGGTWFVELRNNISYVRDLSTRIGVGDTSALNSNAIFLFPSSNGRLLVIKAISGSTTTLYTTTTDTVKIAIKWDGTTADVFANGTKVTSATSFTTTNMETLVGNVGTPVFISQSKLYNQPLSDAECISLTTL